MAARNEPTTWQTRHIPYDHLATVMTSKYSSSSFHLCAIQAKPCYNQRLILLRDSSLESTCNGFLCVKRSETDANNICKSKLLQWSLTD